MNVLFRPIIFLGFITLLGAIPLYSQTEQKTRHIGVGLNYGGAQVDWRASQKWMFELRGQAGKDKSDIDETHSALVGLRTYRFFRGTKLITPFSGLEAAYVEAKQKTGDYRAAGTSLGLYGGLGIKIATHLLLEFDIGPYVIQMREKMTHADESEIDFVGDTSLIYFF